MSRQVVKQTVISLKLTLRNCQVKVKVSISVPVLFKLWVMVITLREE